jgi:hypothetical protein
VATTTKLALKPNLIETGFGVLEVLRELAKLPTPLTKVQLAICRSILLVMQSKMIRQLSEKGASISEIKDALKAQQEEVPSMLEHNIAILVSKAVLQEEPSGETMYYKIVP